ncbi:MAG: hypothetical protein AB1896_11600 [Thermodesulfobacteriota bacterium]
MAILSILVLGPAAVALGQADYPAEMAKIVDQYPGATVLAASSMEESLEVVLQTADQPQAVADFYINALTGRGWKLESNVQAGPAAALVFLKDEKTFDIGIADQGQGQGSLVSLTLEK